MIMNHNSAYHHQSHVALPGMSSLCWTETCPNISSCTKAHLNMPNHIQPTTNMLHYNNNNYLSQPQLQYPQPQPQVSLPTMSYNHQLPQQPYNMWPTQSQFQPAHPSLKMEPVNSLNRPMALQRNPGPEHDSGTESNSASPAPFSPDKQHSSHLNNSRRSSFSSAAPHSILASMLRGDDRVDSSLSSYGDSDSHGFRSRSSTLSSTELPPVRPIPRRCSFSMAAILDKSTPAKEVTQRRNSVSVKQPAGVNTLNLVTAPSTPDLSPLNLHNQSYSALNKLQSSAFEPVLCQNLIENDIDHNNNNPLIVNGPGTGCSSMSQSINQVTSPASSTSTTQAESAPGSPCNTPSDNNMMPMLGANSMCVICSDKASGFHYGVISCEGCKGFFRRSVQKGNMYTCHKSSECAVNRQTRNRCQSCRFEKCLRMGMCKESVRQDRNRKRKMVDQSEEHELHRIQQVQSCIRAVVTAHNETGTAPQHSSGAESPSLSRVLFDQLSPVCTSRLAAFIERIPGYNGLSPQDRLCLMKNAIPQIILLRVAASYLGQPPTPQECGSAPMRDVCSFVCSLRSLFVQLHLFTEELALLTAVCFMSPQCAGLNPMSAAEVDRLRGPLMEALRVQVQLQAHPGRDPNIVFAKLLMKLSEVGQYARVYFASVTLPQQQHQIQVSKTEF